MGMPNMGLPNMGMGMPMNMPGMNINMGIPQPGLINQMDNQFILEKPQKEQYNAQWIKENKEIFSDFDEDKKRNVLGEMMYKKVSLIDDID